MKFLRSLNEEGGGAGGGGDAGGGTAAGFGAVSGSAVAGYRGSLFGGQKSKAKKHKKQKKISVVKFNHESVWNRRTSQMESVEFNDVESRLKAAKRANDTTPSRTAQGFALEDGKGNMVKVYVAAEQGEDFEAALRNAMGDSDDYTAEIAEILFDLQQQFDIKDVEWGDGVFQEEEEEVEAEVEPGEGEEEMDAGETQPEPEDSDAFEDPLETTDLDDELGGEGSEDDTYSALEKIIDMLKANAEAETAKAKAEQAKAEAEIASATNQASKARAKQEEEILDMENHNKQQKEAKEEEELRKKMIKYRHDKKKKELTNEGINMQDDRNADISPEEEEILDMEDWEAQQKEQKKKESIEKRLARFRHEKRKQQQQEEEERVAKMKEIMNKTKASHPREISFKRYVDCRD